MFAMFTVIGIDSKAAMGEFPVVCDFPELFLDDINDFLPKHGVEFD